MGGARFGGAVRLLHPAAPWAYPGGPAPPSVRYRGKNAIAIVTRLSVDFALAEAPSGGIVKGWSIVSATGRQRTAAVWRTTRTSMPGTRPGIVPPPPYPPPQAGEGRVGGNRDLVSWTSSAGS